MENIVSIECGRKLRTKFKLIDIMYKPMKKWDGIINCYFSTDLATAYRAKYVINDDTRHSRAFQCYYCNAYYNKKPRYQQHLERCLGIPGVVYNFANQNLVSFEDNIGNKGDFPLVAYMDFETTAPADNCLNPEQKNMFVVLYALVFAFHPKLNLNRACNHLPFFKIFSILYIFAQIFKYFAFFCSLFALFLKKLHACPYSLE